MMKSILQFLAVCLLLKACAANFNQALQDPTCDPSTDACALPLLEALSIVVGDYSNAHQISRHEHFDQPFVDAVEVDFKPLDIPALNQYHPFLGLQKHKGVHARITIKLTTVDEIGQYIVRAYNLPDGDKYLSGELNFADITMKDLAPTPMATELLVRRKDIVVNPEEWILDEQGNTVVYALNFLCHSFDVVLGEGAPELSTGIPYMLNKTKSYSLPDSWLDGYDDYVNPCSSY